MFKISEFSNKLDLFLYLSREVSSISAPILNENKNLNLLFTGGSMMDLMIKSSLKQDWTKKLPPRMTNLWLTDERVLPRNDQNRNDYRLATAVESHAQKDSFTLKRWRAYSPKDMFSACKEYDQDMDSILGSTKFNVAFLTIGTDGHFAGLWPSHFMATKKNLKSISHSNAPQPFPCRVSMSLKRISRSDQIFLYLIGEKKISLFFANFMNRTEFSFLKTRNTQILTTSRDK